MYSYDRTATGHESQRNALTEGLVKAAQKLNGKFAKDVVSQVLNQDRNALGVVYHDMFDRKAFIRELAKSLSSVVEDLAESMLIELEDRK